MRRALKLEVELLRGHVGYLARRSAKLEECVDRMAEVLGVKDLTDSILEVVNDGVKV